MIAGKNLLDYTNLLCSDNYKKNDKIIYKYFNDTYGRRKQKLRLYTYKINDRKYYFFDGIK